MYRYFKQQTDEIAHKKTIIWQQKGDSPSDRLVSYPGHSLRVGSYPSAEVQLVYSTAPADWAIHRVNVKTVLF